ncbi:lipoprotein bor [Terasakiispira papahanaumokuakeensis]|uniref:Lipoprotein bor n=1 Tax=Terasakiispira papahanaumokuakeensis TaxID=197479 RepID=A0A1E2V6Y2_9GAMM|nr:Bor family protein [Terasakiispira papahanaumokuakeensis]ODC02778.1 lipoprotein bor [Terasakiispira papahanaumokuakeensis]
MKKLLLVGLVAVLMAGCSNQRFVMQDDSQSNAADYKRAQPFFINGIGQRKTVNAAEVCGGAENVVRVETQQTFGNVVLSVVTFGIYTPREARIYCK